MTHPSVLEKIQWHQTPIVVDIRDEVSILHFNEQVKALPGLKKFACNFYSDQTFYQYCVSWDNGQRTILAFTKWFGIADWKVIKLIDGEETAIITTPYLQFCFDDAMDCIEKDITN